MVFMGLNGRDKPVSTKFTMIVLQMALVREDFSFYSGTRDEYTVFFNVGSDP